MKKFGKTSGAVALGLGLAAAAPFAVAQQAPDAVMEKIEITGSYIRRTDAETPSPVQVLTSEDLRNSGLTSVADVLTSLTASNNGALTQAFSGAFAQGASGVSLRGLTVGATLVLIDGHRMAPYPIADDGQRNFVDISGIPFDAVDRIEILKDGASATYGSDAMAGVVNVILKKSFKGVAVSGENGWSHRGGGETSHVTGTVGFGDLVENGSNAFVTVEYRHADPIYLEQRPYINQLDYSPLGGYNLTPGANNFVNGGSSAPAIPSGYWVNKALSAGAANPFLTYGYLPGCSGTALTNNQCEYSHPWDVITPATQNINILGRFTTNLGNGWQGSITASLFESSDLVSASPFATSTSKPTYFAPAPGPGGVTLTNFNVLPGPYQAPVPANLATSLGVTAGTLLPFRKLLTELGQRNTAVKNDAYRFVGDIKGSAGGWDVDATYGWTEEIQQSTKTGYPIYTTLYNDLASGAFLAAGGNTAAEIQKVAPAIVDNYTSLLWFTGIHGSHDLFSLPGGKAAVATGADFYYHSNYFVPGQQETSALQAPNFAYALGTQSDWSLFLEGDFPVLKTLEVNAAVRHDHVNTYGSSTVPKIGFKFTPIPQIALRSTFSKGFRAPNTVESGSSAAAGFAGYFPDPVLCANTATGTPRGQVVGNYPNQCSIPYVSVTNANPTLQPEKSTSKTIGLILEPTKWLSFSTDYYDIKINNMIISGSQDPYLSATAVRGSPSAQPYVNAPGSTTTQTPAVGDFLYYSTPYINLGYVETKGFEFDLRNRFDFGAAGKIRSDLQWTLMSSYILSLTDIGGGGGNFQLVGTHGPNQISADTGTPRNRAKWAITYEKGPVEVTTTVNYVDGFDVTDPSYDAALPGLTGVGSGCQGLLAFSQGWPNGGPTNLCHISSLTTVDMYGSYNVNKNWQVHLGITNLLDREAPQDAQTYAQYNLNTAYHMSGAIGRFYTVGASYKF